MPFSDAAKNIMLATLPSPITVSLHTADPGLTGAHEVSGGTYARKTATLEAASSGARAATSSPVFDVPSGNTVTHAGYWDGSTFIGGAELPIATVFAIDDTYTLNGETFTIAS